MNLRCSAGGLGTKLAILVIGGMLSATVQAQSDPASGFPAKAIHLVVNFAAGGGTDIFARVIAPKMFRDAGQPVVVENRTGAGGIIGADYVAKAPADGYTLLLAPLTTMTVNPAIYPKLPYSPIRDFAPVSIVSLYPYLFVVTKSVPVRSMKELIAYAKANPQKANYAGASPIFQLTNVLFRMVTGASMEYVCYRSSTESVSAVMSGEVLMTLSDAPPLTGPIRNGRVLALGVTSATRISSFPDIPTMAELGLPNLEMSSGNGVLAPAGTPPAIVAKLQNELIRIVKLPDVGERFRALAAEPAGGTSEEFRQFIASEISRWSAVAKAGNIKIEE